MNADVILAKIIFAVFIKFPLPMSRTLTFTAFLLFCSVLPASAERIKRKQPTDIEAARVASDQVMNDTTLHKGDVVVTDRGFFQFRGLTPDGSFDFLQVPSPMKSFKKEMLGNSR